MFLGGAGGKETREAKKRRQRVMRLVSALSPLRRAQDALHAVSAFSLIWLGGRAFNAPSTLKKRPVELKTEGNVSMKPKTELN